MSAITLRPDLKTAGGEVSDILSNGEFIGTFTVVYRETDRLSGAIQLDEQSLSASDKQEVISFMQGHVKYLIDALMIRQCEVLITYSKYDQIISTQESIDWEASKEFEFADDDAEWVHDENQFDDIDPDGIVEIDMSDRSADDMQYELVIVEENRKGITYHVYDQDSDLVATAYVNMHGPDIEGDVNWSFSPFEEEMDLVTELIVRDCDEEEVDSILLHMKVDGEIVETVQLTHTDLLDDEADLEIDGMYDHDLKLSRDDYTIVLARDDGDALTYEIYQQSYGGLPIGTATVDISDRQISGFIDFREPGSPDDRELIASLLLEELDKEKEYETVNLSMLYRNKLIDEILFETEHVH